MTLDPEERALGTPEPKSARDGLLLAAAAAVAQAAYHRGLADQLTERAAGYRSVATHLEAGRAVQ